MEATEEHPEVRVVKGGKQVAVGQNLRICCGCGQFFKWYTVYCIFFLQKRNLLVRGKMNKTGGSPQEFLLIHGLSGTGKTQQWQSSYDAFWHVH